MNPIGDYPDIYIANIPLNNGQMISLKDKKPFSDNMIVEMQYNSKSKEGLRWKPLRIRDDKNFPNRFDTARNVWNTIVDPITEEMITGNYDYYKLNDEIITNVDDENYYKTNQSSRGGELDPLRDLHNFIKSKLIEYAGSQDNKNIMIMDTSIGRGGDIQKYLKIKNVSFIFGLDISNNTKEACRRYYFSKQKRKPNSVIIQYDTSKSIEYLEEL